MSLRDQLREQDQEHREAMREACRSHDRSMGHAREALAARTAQLRDLVATVRGLGLEPQLADTEAWREAIEGCGEKP